MKSWSLLLSTGWFVSSQTIQPNQHQGGEGILCRCELPGENLYDLEERESYIPLRIGDFYVLDQYHESCKVSHTPLVDAVVHGIQHWASYFYHGHEGDDDDHHHRRRRRSLMKNYDGERTTDNSNLRLLSHTIGNGIQETQQRHGIAPFICPDFETLGISASDSPSSIPSSAPLAVTELPSVLFPTLEIVGTNETNTDGPRDCPANTLDQAPMMFPGDGFVGTFDDMAIPWYVVACNSTESTQEQIAVWVPVLGNGDQLQVSTCSPETNFLTSIQVVSGENCSNLTCVVENPHATGNCPSPNIFGSTVTWFSEPNVQYWVLVFPRGDETASSSDQFGLSLESILEEADTPVPTAAPIFSIVGEPTSYPTAAPLANISPVYQGAYILDDNHSCESAVRLSLKNNTSDSILGTTIGAPNATTCWNNFITPVVWFSIVGTGQILELSMEERVTPFPPLLSILQGDSCDDQSLCLATGLDTVAWQSNRGEQYWVLLQGRDGPGDYGLMARSVGS